MIFYYEVAIIAMVQFLSASANTKTYHLVGGNTATVVTGPRKCSNGQTTDVTMTVYAVLYSNSSRRSYFLNRKFDKRMELLDQWPSDKKGHILSSVFGGPAEIWNLAPHEPRGRRLTFRDTIMTGWYECERWIENALKTNDHLPVNATMKLTYDKAGSCRPTYWSIEATNSNPSQCPANNVIKGFGGSITCRKPT